MVTSLPMTKIKPAIRFRVNGLEDLKKRAYAEAVAKGRARAVGCCS